MSECVLVGAVQVLQLYQITQLHHGLMMVGPSGSGKSSAWRVLLKALERIEGVEGVAHIIDPKVGGASWSYVIGRFNLFSRHFVYLLSVLFQCW